MLGNLERGVENAFRSEPLLSPAEKLYREEQASKQAQLGHMLVKEAELEKVIAGHVEEARAETELLEKRVTMIENGAKGVGVLLLLWILHAVLLGGGSSGPRMDQMENEIQGLQLLWSKPENAILNAKYTVLAAELNKYQTEITKFEAFYRNMTIIDKQLGDIRAQISGIKTLQSDADKIIGKVKSALTAMTAMEAKIDAKLQKGLGDARAKAAAVGVEAVGTQIEKLNKTVVAFDEQNSKSVAAAVATVDSAIKQMHQDIDGYEIKTKKDLLASVAQQMSTMEGRVDAKATTIAENAQATAIAKAAAVTDGLRALVTSAKEAGDKALAGIENVGFFKMRGSDCPAGSEPCRLWHFMSPELLDPYCGRQQSKDAVSGSCHESGSTGELEQKMYGCCRNKATLSTNDAVDIAKVPYCTASNADTSDAEGSAQCIP